MIDIDIVDCIASMNFEHEIGLGQTLDTLDFDTDAMGRKCNTL